jgi:hypothetical protein
VLIWALLAAVSPPRDLYGKSYAEMARVDELLDGLEDMRVKTKVLVYTDCLSDEGFEKYAASVLAPPPGARAPPASGCPLPTAHCSPPCLPASLCSRAEPQFVVACAHNM